MREYVTVYYGKGPIHHSLQLFPEVAAALGLRESQKIDDETLARATIAQAQAGMAVCELGLAMNEFDREVIAPAEKSE